MMMRTQGLRGRGLRGRAIARRAAVCIAALCVAAGTAGAANAPIAPPTSSGAYTVSYGDCSHCNLLWLEERPASGGDWTTVGDSEAKFANKAPGVYEYRAALLYWGINFDYDLVYSPTATVIVGTDLPTVQSLDEQHRHRYRVRVGYHNGDGVPDLFVERESGGEGLDGTLERLLLLGRSGGQFTPLVPSSAAAAAARSWPDAAVRVLLHDVNLDGFVDVLVGSIGRVPGLSGAPGQILLAPGRVGFSAPTAVVPLTGALRSFGNDVIRYLADRDYFSNTAPVRINVITTYDFSCLYRGYDLDLWGYVEYCYPYPVRTYIAVPDYSGFSSDAIAVWRAESRIETGTTSRPAGYGEIESIVEGTLGTVLNDRELKRILGEADGIVESSLERGIELFAAMAGIGNAVAQDDGSEGAGSNAPDAVLLTGRRVIGFGPFHTALQYGFTTVSAYDDDARALFDGTLVSQVNWAPDHPSLTLRLGTVSSIMAPALYWQRLLVADSRYGDDLPYDAVPSIGAGGFNSNGFVAGIIAATGGVPSIPMTDFVGGERPVPAGEFN